MHPSEHQPDFAHAWRRPAGELPVLIAHRGAPTEELENTLESFQRAQEAGAVVVEMDVRTTADGELVVLHDAVVDRISDGHGAVAELTLAELRALCLRDPHNGQLTTCRVPRLEDVFAALPTAAMNVDLKAVAATDLPQIFAWIRATQKRPDTNLRVLLTSASKDTQKAIFRHRHQASVLLGMGRCDVLQALAAAWLRLRPIERLRGRACQMPAYVIVLGINVPLLAGPLPHYLKSMGCSLHVWWDAHGMVNDRAQLAQCAAWGVDGVFTDEIRKMAIHRRQTCGRA